MRHSWTAAATACAILLTAGACRAQDSDPWWGRDKAMHFSASAVIAAGGYAVGTSVFDARYEAMILGAGVATAAGVGKEAADAAGAGDPSWRDLAWDAAGMVVGVGVAWGVDLLWRGEGTDHPVLKSPGMSGPGVLVLRF